MSPRDQSGRSFRSLLGLPDSKPTPSDSVLIIIDAQNEYDHGLLAIHEVEKSRQVIGQVLQKWRDGKGDVVHILHETPEGAPFFTPGTELEREFEELGVWEGEEVRLFFLLWPVVIRKPKPCAFSDTPLHSHLQKLGKQKIVLVGYMAHVCISATSRMGDELDYDVSVISDAIGDRDIPGAKAEQLITTVLAELGDSRTLGKDYKKTTSKWLPRSKSPAPRDQIEAAIYTTMKLVNLLTLLYLSPLINLSFAARCDRDNCLRALAATPTKASSFCATYTQTPNTASAVPTYASFCGNSPSRASSACSCVVTSTTPPTSPTCVPTPVIKGSIGNGNFENYPPPGQGVFNIQPPWYFNSRDSENAYGDFKTEPAGAGFGGTVAVFHLQGQPPNLLPGAFLRLQQPIAYCNGTTYAFSLFARQLPPLAQSCRLSFFTDFEGTIASFETPQLSDRWTRFGPVTRRPFRDNGEVNEKGEWMDLLSVLVQCTGVEGQQVKDTVVEVDSVVVEPVLG
ncbi:MAG: hypothetical protein Q9223_004205 [Gallowayella weberi]